MRNLLTALFLCFAILVGIVETASGASTPHGPKTASGDFWENPNICTYKLGSLELEPCRGDTIVGYDSATGVLYYVRQNPWTSFDPHGLAEEKRKTVGEIYELKSDKNQYTGQATRVEGNREFAEQRLNTGYQQHKDVATAENARGKATQVTVSDSARLNKKQTEELMKAAESIKYHEGLDSSLADLNKIDTSGGKMYDLDKAQEIFKTHGASWGDARDFSPVVGPKGGIGWRPTSQMGTLSGQGYSHLTKASLARRLLRKLPVVGGFFTAGTIANAPASERGKTAVMTISGADVAEAALNNNPATNAGKRNVNRHYNKVNNWYKMLDDPENPDPIR